MVKVFLAAAAAVILSVPVCASGADSQAENVLRMEVDGSEAASVETEIENGLLTIRIKDNGEERKGYSWEYDRLGPDEDSCVECITDTDMEEGYLYVGSFRGIRDGVGTVRLNYTNGSIVSSYMTFELKVEDEKITESVGGGYAYPTSGEDLLPALEGLWVSGEGTEQETTLTFGLAGDGGLSATAVWTGEEGEPAYYTMTAYYDALEEKLVYLDGNPEAEGPAEEAADSGAGQAEEAASAAEPAEGTGGDVEYGCLIVDSSDGETVDSITWVRWDTEDDDVVFVRPAEEEA